jgi:2-C-methyl-D-erythritol 4-phosphate cytidylyltransferase / 2-C-methyl-D-erythritol 2,4-cyclodiphosphate synthase
MKATLKVWTIVVAGGSGARFGGPKQFLDLVGRPVFVHSVDGARSASDAVVLVVPVSDVDSLAGEADVVVGGGASRAESVACGLAVIPDDVDIICVHDAARPLATGELYRRLIDALVDGVDGVIPGVGVVDTIKQTDREGRVVATPDRALLRAVQTPQVFRADTLRLAHRDAVGGTDDAVMVEAVGGTVIVIDGEANNRKVTVPEDLIWARQVLADHAGAGEVSGERTAAGHDRAMSTPAQSIPALRIGQGFDAHRTSTDPTRVLVLGGVRFDGEPGLEGHSDADAVAHAVTDAILGAAGLADIGQLFPDTDAAYAGADSIDLLRQAVTLVQDAGWQVVNVDCSLICERPKVAPRRAEMEQILSTVVGAPVTVKGRRPEQMGALGRREGIVCLSSALLSATKEA